MVARALREMDFCWSLIENNLRALKIVELARTENGHPRAAEGTFHFLGSLVSNHFEDLLFGLTVYPLHFQNFQITVKK